MEITALSPDLLSGILKYNAISLTPVYRTVMCIILSPNSCVKVRFPPRSLLHLQYINICSAYLTASQSLSVIQSPLSRNQCKLADFFVTGRITYYDNLQIQRINYPLPYLGTFCLSSTIECESHSDD